ncbi:MAG: YdeI/OmpD-associated family protein [Pseudomonadota bacterium]
MTTVAVESADALWAWLGDNHAQPDGVWLITHKKGVGHDDKYVGREDVLDALVAHGWIDGRRKVVDDIRTMQFISPRRVEHWSKTYKDRAARLAAEGRMHPAGDASVAAGKASGLWTFMDDVDALVVPGDLDAALKDHGARAAWDDLAPSYRRNVLRWIKLAKTAPTRDKRLLAAATHTARGEKIAQM